MDQFTGSGHEHSGVQRQRLSASDVENLFNCRPVAAIHDDAATMMFDQLEAWAGALKPLRKEAAY